MDFYPGIEKPVSRETRKFKGKLSRISEYLYYLVYYFQILNSILKMFVFYTENNETLANCATSSS